VNSRSTQCSEEALEEPTSNLAASRDYRSSHSLEGNNVVRNVPQGHGNNKGNLSPILHLLYAFNYSTKTPGVFNQTEWKGMLSSSLLLNIERLLILKQQRKEDFDYWRKITEESNLEVYRRIHDKPIEAEH